MKKTPFIQYYGAKGLSLVELMVALLLGSIIAAAATQLFLVNSQTNNLRSGLAFVQDQGRFAFSYISRDLMQAGFSDSGALLTPFVFVNTTVPGGEVSGDDSTNNNDVLVMQVDGGRDCIGNIFTGVKVYEVNADNGLLCKTRAYDEATDTWSVDSEVVVEGVMAFQVLYGIDTDSLGDPGYGAADFYSSASNVVPATDRIVTVRYGLLIASDRSVTSDTAFAPANVRVLDQNYGQADIPLNDGRAYRVYTSTVGMRNLKDS